MFLIYLAKHYHFDYSVSFKQKKLEYMMDVPIQTFDNIKKAYVEVSFDEKKYY